MTCVMSPSRRLVIDAISRNHPARLPIEDLSNPDVSDIVGVGFEPCLWHWKGIQPGVEECLDLFGCTRRRLDRASIGEVTRGVIESWEDLERFALPDATRLRESVTREMEVLPEDRFVLGDLGQFMTRILELRGYANALMDMKVHPDRIRTLAGALTEFAIGRIDLYLQCGPIHGIAVYDDWGTQSALFVDPELWRDLFWNEYRTLFHHAHQRGLYTYFHSCGAVGPILPDMIAAGVDIFNFDQPRLLGLEHLAQNYGSRATFSCPVDIQKILPTGDPESIAKEIGEMVHHLHRKGGLIAKIFHLNETDRLGRKISNFNPSEFCLSEFRSFRWLSAAEAGSPSPRESSAGSAARNV